MKPNLLIISKEELKTLLTKMKKDSAEVVTVALEERTILSTMIVWKIRGTK